MQRTLTLKFQFVLAFSIFITGISFVGAITAIRQLYNAVTESYAAQGIHIAQTAASFIDGDRFEALVNSLDKDDPFYEETRLRLYQLREYTASLYLYTLAPKSGDIWQFIIDGSVEPGAEYFSYLGEEIDINYYGDAVMRAWTIGGAWATGLVNQGEWGWLISAYAPIRNSAGVTVGIAAVDFDGQPLHESILSKAVLQGVIGLVSLLVGIMFVMFFMRRIFTPLNKITEVLKKVGEGDLTHNIEVNSKNEIGNFARYINQSIENIKNIVISIRKEASTLTHIGNDLTSSMNGTYASVNEITANIQNIKNRVINQSASVIETGSTMKQLVENIKKMDGHVDNQNDHIAQVISSIEEMVEKIRSVTETLVKNNTNMKILIDASEVGRNGLREVAENFNQIAHESQGLMEINSVMENIASQTNLLSMNAAIEAAHAGEAGKGFAVVAAEIRKLAEDSSNQSKTIGVVLKKMKGSIEQITRSTENVLNKFEAIDSNVKTVAAQEDNIRETMEEQEGESRHLLDRVGDVNSITKQVSDSSGEMITGAGEVIRESADLEKITQEIASGMNEMASGTNHINTAVNYVNEISRKNSEAINTLIYKVTKFKVE